MYCTKCGAKVPDESAFCFKCGSQLPSLEFENDFAEIDQAEKSQPAPKKRLSTWILSLLLLFMVLGFTRVLLTDSAISTTTAVSNPPLRQFFSQAMPTPMPTPYWSEASFNVGREAFAIKPGEYFYFPIEVQPSWRGARLTGKFLAQGGGGNDVYVTVTDDDGLMNFQNRHGFRSFYSSGKVTTDTITVPLPPGKFYLIVSNTFSVFAHKSVTLNVQLEYSHLVQP